MNALDQIAKSVKGQMSEIFDGYVVVGFVAGSNEPMIIGPRNMDPKTVIALNQLLVAAIRPELSQTGDDTHPGT